MFGRKSPGGLIAYYGLESWWMTRWTGEERTYLARKWDTASTLGAPPSPLCTGRPPEGLGRVGADHPGRMISDLGAMLLQADEFHLARKLFEDAERTLPADDWHNRHFLYNSAGHICYRRREDTPDGLALAIHYFSEQVAISEKARQPMIELFLTLPGHRGFEQLAIIHAANGEYAEAIALCGRAREGGWMGDWDKRIERYRKAQSKQQA